jgi:hypothetical protein
VHLSSCRPLYGCWVKHVIDQHLCAPRLCCCCCCCCCRALATSASAATAGSTTPPPSRASCSWRTRCSSWQHSRTA